VEANNFAIRKHLLEYDDVMNKQREVVYANRLMALESEDISAEITDILEKTVDRRVESHAPEGAHPEEWNAEGLQREMEALFLWPFELGDTSDPRMTSDDLKLKLKHAALEAYAAKQKEVGYEEIKSIERGLLLYVIDKHWRDHLYDLDGVRAGIGLRAYGQKDPLIEYKSEAFELFMKMLESTEEEVVKLLFQGRWVKSEPRRPASQPVMRAFKPEAAAPRPAPVAEPAVGPVRGSAAPRPPRRKRGPGGTPRVAGVKVGRNDPCPCGSGKKYKKCCGK
jgi:preprotein translocase subunit SecA